MFSVPFSPRARIDQSPQCLAYSTQFGQSLRKGKTLEHTQAFESLVLRDHQRSIRKAGVQVPTKEEAVSCWFSAVPWQSVRQVPAHSLWGASAEKHSWGCAKRFRVCLRNHCLSCLPIAQAQIYDCTLPQLLAKPSWDSSLCIGLSATLLPATRRNVVGNTEPRVLAVYEFFLKWD